MIGGVSSKLGAHSGRTCIAFCWSSSCSGRGVAECQYGPVYRGLPQAESAQVARLLADGQLSARAPLLVGLALEHHGTAGFPLSLP